MAGTEHTSGYWLNTDGYKNLDKTQQASIQQDYVNMNKNQQAGKFNGFGAQDIAKKYGLYTAPTVDQKINSANQSRQDSFQKAQNGWYDNAENRKYSTSDELFAYDLYKQNGDTTFWNPTKAGATSPYDDLQQMFGLPSMLGNNRAYDVWKNQDMNFKANTMAGQAMGYMPGGYGDGQSQGGTGGGGGAGGGAGKGEFDDFLKMFMLMMMQGQGGQGQQNQFTPMQYGDGVHLFDAQPSTTSSTGAKLNASRDDMMNKLLKDLGLWEGEK